MCHCCVIMLLSVTVAVVAKFDAFKNVKTLSPCVCFPASTICSASNKNLYSSKCHYFFLLFHYIPFFYYSNKKLKTSNGILVYCLLHSAHYTCPVVELFAVCSGAEMCVFYACRKSKTMHSICKIYCRKCRNSMVVF